MAKPVAHTDGVIVVDKARDFTSFDVVAIMRGIVGQKKIGHAGTLDPDATGVLVIALGKATKLLRFTSDYRKHYVGEIVLGTTTTTLDNKGDVTGTFDMSDVTLADVQTVAEKFVGDIQQVPPMVSALRVGGRRLHELAREGIEVEREARPVTVYSLSIEPVSKGIYRIDAACSSGTYIRTLAADIGEALGGGAHLQNLRRTGVGPFDIDTAVSLDELQEDWRSHVQPIGSVVAHYQSHICSEQERIDVSYGRPLKLEIDNTDPVAILDSARELLAVYKPDGRGKWRSVVTLPNS